MKDFFVNHYCGPRNKTSKNKSISCLAPHFSCPKTCNKECDLFPTDVYILECKVFWGFFWLMLLPVLFFILNLVYVVCYSLKRGIACEITQNLLINKKLFLVQENVSLIE